MTSMTEPTQTRTQPFEGPADPMHKSRVDRLDGPVFAPCLSSLCRGTMQQQAVAVHTENQVRGGPWCRQWIGQVCDHCGAVTTYVRSAGCDAVSERGL